MPRQDKTGPTGEGQSTGRGLGSCNPGDEGTVGELRYGVGREFQKDLRRGYGAGMGRNMRTGESTREMLLEEKKILEDRLAEVNRELNQR